MSTHEELQQSESTGFFPGALAGLAAGTVMIAAAMIHSMLNGFSFWFPLQQIAALVYGVDALIRGGDATVVGSLVHAIVSVGFGIVFGLSTVRRRSVWVFLLIGIIYGGIVWAVMSYGALPFINPVMSERVALIPGAWLAYHLLFGIVLGAGMRLLTVSLPKYRRGRHANDPDDRRLVQPA